MTVDEPDICDDCVNKKYFPDCWDRNAEYSVSPGRGSLIRCKNYGEKNDEK